MSVRRIRIGIDVGGTFTHAVAIDHASLEVVRRACRSTTHSAPEGVARGIWECLETLVYEAAIKPEEVVFIAHSTTQATNALLEGDVARVGLIGIVAGAAGLKATKELSFNRIDISGDRSIEVSTVFVKPGTAGEEAAAFLDGPGAGLEAFAVAEPFGVENPEHEAAVVELLAGRGLPATASHEVSGLYGLRARARTSAVNAAILPRMMEVADMTRAAVEKLGLQAELMIMRSDGGVMTASGMKKTPIMTILSGPAAGVSAAILHEKIANGLFVEIGGTSTDISLVQDGRPKSKQAVVGGNVLYLKTLDVRTVAAAGGSMIRISGGRVSNVGPRSAHIAGLPYSCFTDLAEWTSPSVDFISPVDGDPGDYAVIDTGAGRRVAVTATCAANALGLLGEDDYALGNAESSLRAFELLAEKTGAKAEELARQAIRSASEKIEKACRDLMKEYPVRGAQLSLVGGGGGAGVLAPAAAESLGLPFSMAADAEVVSAVGVGMALLKNVIEKSIVDPTDDDVRKLRSAAVQSLIDAGGDPDRIEVDVEIDRKTNIVRATATGSTALAADRSSEKISPEAAVKIARRTLGGNPSSLEIRFEDSSCYVVAAEVTRRGFLGLGGKISHPVVVVDSHGLAKLTLPDADIIVAGRDGCVDSLREAVSRRTTYGDGGAVAPAAYLVAGSKVIDLSKLADPDKMADVAAIEVAEQSAADSFCILIAR